MKIETVGVIGAGLMGSGIAQVCAVAGLKVVLRDLNEAALTKGVQMISASLDRAVTKGKMSAEEKERALASISTHTETGALAQADFIIEAATENVEIKLAILKEVEAVAKAEAVIASNTSSVSITKLAAALSRPERLIGMHFFNPVPMMSLVELIRGIQTSDTTFATTDALSRQIGKTPISVKNAPGFVVNRILVPMMNEAIFVLQEGLATREDIDLGMRLGTGQPMGPLALCDLVGLDTLLAVLKVFYHDFNDPKYRPAPLLQEMVDAGYLGRKSGRGFYEY
ncbi:3-hydroxybutyryl-CoA dehydrogenase [Noviherbaspirillum sp.]|uniref:3-hydroxybutyryl-CoA dehydrogenase n=1 Tax=Noviherbaspirillum sp. TaxID=1926288 RepID=UPI002D2B3E5C|nr:3-hydroxybutyryl-CoA dehydrogenase [Noviherbaspirillum sp.]HZW20002.1 3-hydroxybutyryl-CoA dehydrogenase [Noviherbaspirillum sp.]